MTKDEIDAMTPELKEKTEKKAAASSDIADEKRECIVQVAV